MDDAERLLTALGLLVAVTTFLEGFASSRAHRRLDKATDEANSILGRQLRTPARGSAMVKSTVRQLGRTESLFRIPMDVPTVFLHVFASAITAILGLGIVTASEPSFDVSQWQGVSLVAMAYVIFQVSLTIMSLWDRRRVRRLLNALRDEWIENVIVAVKQDAVSRPVETQGDDVLLGLASDSSLEPHRKQVLSARIDVMAGRAVALEEFRRQRAWRELIEDLPDEWKDRLFNLGYRDQSPDLNEIKTLSWPFSRTSLWSILRASHGVATVRPDWIFELALAVDSSVTPANEILDQKTRAFSRPRARQAEEEDEIGLPPPQCIPDNPSMYYDVILLARHDVKASVQLEPPSSDEEWVDLLAETIDLCPGPKLLAKRLPELTKRKARLASGPDIEKREVWWNIAEAARRLDVYCRTGEVNLWARLSNEYSDQGRGDKVIAGQLSSRLKLAHAWRSIACGILHQTIIKGSIDLERASDINAIEYADDRDEDVSFLGFDSKIAAQATGAPTRIRLESPGTWHDVVSLCQWTDGAVPIVIFRVRRQGYLGDVIGNRGTWPWVVLSFWSMPEDDVLEHPVFRDAFRQHPEGCDPLSEAPPGMVHTCHHDQPG